MNLKEKKYCWLFSGAEENNFVSGFTKPCLPGIITEDAEKILSELEITSAIAEMNQIHSEKIHQIDKPGSYTGDGLFTVEKNIMLIVKTADCMPLVFFSRKEGVSGIIHMGWKGAGSGILDNIEFDLSSFTVVAGAGLRKCCYHVGNEFKNYKRLSGFLTEEDEYHSKFDPVRFVKSALLSKGMKESNFHDINICSYCSPLNLFSYRRNRHLKNRTLSFVVRI